MKLIGEPAWFGFHVANDCRCQESLPCHEGPCPRFRREGLGRISQRLHETLDRLAHRLVIVDDRNQGLCLWHTNSRTWTCENHEAPRSEALERGMEEKSKEFVEKGAELYAKL